MVFVFWKFVLRMERELVGSLSKEVKSFGDEEVKNFKFRVLDRCL